MQHLFNRFLEVLYRRPVFWLAWAAALFYSSWPLGFILNPGVAHHLLASELEAPHQPFNWLFITTDVLTGLTVTLIGIVQLRVHKRKVLTNISIITYVLFGVLVATAALSPLNCDPGSKTSTCGALIHHPIVLIHGIASILSVILLLVSILFLGPLIRHYMRISKVVRALFICMLGSWAVFGVGSLLELMFHIQGNTLQYYFMSVCSLSIIFIVSVIEHIGAHEKRILPLVPDDSDQAGVDTI